MPKGETGLAKVTSLYDDEDALLAESEAKFEGKPVARRTGRWRRNYSGDEIVTRLNLAERMERHGGDLSAAAAVAGVSESTLCRWRKSYGGLSPEVIKLLRDLMTENLRLKRVIQEYDLVKGAANHE